MDKPVIADRKPKAVTLNAGEDYFFCRCGRSSNQPFCDGSHRGTSFTPQKFSVDEDGKAHLCMCKHSKNQPFCDGTHAKLPKEIDALPQTATSNSEAIPTAEEPTVAEIHELAKNGLKNLGHHGEMAAMGVPRNLLPDWNDIQIITAQMATKPLMEEADVGTGLVIGPNARKPMELKIPLFVSDMSFGALSEEAKTALAKGAELAGTGICSGEGGMLAEEQRANSRYFYELASAQFGFDMEKLANVQAFHFKGGQGAKTGTGGHLPGAKVTEKIAQVRGLKAGQDAISPPTFRDLHTPADFRKLADEVRETTGGIPIGFKLSANHIEADIAFALKASADYIILDGRGGGTGAAPLLFRDHISVPTIPALARARHYLDHVGRPDVTLIITGGLRTAPDFIKAMALGADGVALANSAMQAVGCIAARMCNTNNCPVGIATQKPALREKLLVEPAARQLANFLESSVELMQVMARACGHRHLSGFNRQDIATFHRDMADLSGISFSGFESARPIPA
ncbi:glutamate synthase-related protein [Aestuariispira insulae]|uniref:Glutamate synthase domain-containing protein 2 n=1 Tax=Aestuariispira insulae TaxID=1461337 RepID=A0A3D9H5W0_9PROT|nr:glutamate synthase-related protein [Aestuariispira insulae]RED44829.1 glutamate synthase domain-containing protein 2 [Aestuariispira insulae]